MSQFNIIKIYTIFTQQKDTKYIQVLMDYKLGDIGTVISESYNIKILADIT